VDEVMRSLQGTFDQAPVEQVRPLSMWVGVVERDDWRDEKQERRRWLWLK
jgi:hypothetical protein